MYIDCCSPLGENMRESAKDRFEYSVGATELKSTVEFSIMVLMHTFKASFSNSLLLNKVLDHLC